MPINNDDIEITNGEIRRNFESLRADVFRAMTKIEMKLDAQPFLRADVFEERMKGSDRAQSDNEREIASVKATLGRINSIAWTGIILPLGVMILGAIIVAAVGIPK